MALCCDFLARRLSLFAEMKHHCTLAERHAELLRQHNASWLNLWNADCGVLLRSAWQNRQDSGGFRARTGFQPCIHSCTGQADDRDDRKSGLSGTGGLRQVSIGRSEGLLAVCEGMHYALVALHIRIQTAAAYEMLGKHAEAQAQLDQALTDAEPDGFVMPFAENYRYLKPLLAERLQTGTVRADHRTGRSRRAATEPDVDRPAALSALTEREYELVRPDGTAAEQPRDRGKAVSCPRAASGSMSIKFTPNCRSQGDARAQSASCCSTCLRIKY